MTAPTEFRLLRAELRERSGLPWRIALVAGVTMALTAFAAALPAYAASFTAVLEHAAYDVAIVGAFAPADVDRVRKTAGVEDVAPTFGLFGVVGSGPGGTSTLWVWTVDDDAAGELTPLNSDYLAVGAYELGSAERPSVVIDRDTARALGAAVGSSITLTLPEGSIDVEVSGITGPASRLRGPSIITLREPILARLPPSAELEDTPYTELLVRGSASPADLARLFPVGTVGLATRDEQMEAQRQQMEVDPGVIAVVSRLAAVALGGFVLLLIWTASQRRGELLSLATHFGASRAQLLRIHATLEAGPAMLALAAGVMLGLQVVVNSYLGGIGAYVDLATSLRVAAALGGIGLLLHLAVIVPRIWR